MGVSWLCQSWYAARRKHWDPDSFYHSCSQALRAHPSTETFLDTVPWGFIKNKHHGVPVSLISQLLYVPLGMAVGGREDISTELGMFLLAHLYR